MIPVTIGVLEILVAGITASLWLGMLVAVLVDRIGAPGWLGSGPLTVVVYTTLAYGVGVAVDSAADELFAAAGSFRLAASADRLLAMGEQPKWARALDAALTVSGFDQDVQDPEDENPDRRWEEKQFPRHDAILARMLRRAVELRANSSLATFLPSARWAAA